MLEQVCSHIHNWFEVDAATGKSHILRGRWQLTATAFVDPPVGIIAGQHFRIRGSVLNDGVYVYSPNGILDETGTYSAQLKPETFDGEVWLMYVPRSVLALAQEIKDYQDKYGEATKSPYVSESVIGVYSYERMQSSKVRGGSPFLGWQDVFKEQLKPWRKVSER